MHGYRQFCPIAKATEILCERWTLLVVRELLHGSRHYNDLRRGLPLMSPALLTRRLRSLEDSGVVLHRTDSGSRRSEYVLTQAGLELAPLLGSIGIWGQRWARRQLRKEDHDAGLLLWVMRRGLRTGSLPARKRTVIMVSFAEQRSALRDWWLVVDKGDVQLCLKDPGFSVDVKIDTDLQTLTGIWLGDRSLQSALADRSLRAAGPRELLKSMRQWLGLSSFAAVARP